MSNWQNILLSGDVYGDSSLPYYTPFSGDQSSYTIVTNIVDKYIKALLGLELYQEYSSDKVAEIAGTPLPQRWEDFESAGIYDSSSGCKMEHFDLKIMLAWFLRAEVANNRAVQLGDFGGKRDTGSTVERMTALNERVYIHEDSFNKGVSEYYFKQQFLISEIDDYDGLSISSITAINTFSR